MANTARFVVEARAEGTDLLPRDFFDQLAGIACVELDAKVQVVRYLARLQLAGEPCARIEPVLGVKKEKNYNVSGPVGLNAPCPVMLTV